MKKTVFAILVIFLTSRNVLARSASDKDDPDKNLESFVNGTIEAKDGRAVISIKEWRAQFEGKVDWIDVELADKVIVLFRKKFSIPELEIDFVIPFYGGRMGQRIQLETLSIYYHNKSSGAFRR